ncbi:hypothetical protein [Nocardiopsis sp. CC223A]|uniref:hypothetical protein n=1 Tax=Nocardiopsis sp. CC223A TaxID=3044051 RepID=UPI00278BF46B|nr:hypothetical protein [Nocardiopsis sp. CC223A]
MRTVFMFPATGRDETIAMPDRRLPAQRDPWIMEDALHIDIDDEPTGYLFRGWDPEDVAVLDAALGYHPARALQVNVTGRVDGTAELHRLAALLLEHGGAAYDDHSRHAWTLREIEEGTVIDGLRFFDFRTHYERFVRKPASDEGSK